MVYLKISSNKCIWSVKNKNISWKCHICKYITKKKNIEKNKAYKFLCKKCGYNCRKCYYNNSLLMKYIY